MLEPIAKQPNLWVTAHRNDWDYGVDSTSPSQQQPAQAVLQEHIQPTLCYFQSLHKCWGCQGIQQSTRV